MCVNYVLVAPRHLCGVLTEHKAFKTDFSALFLSSCQWIFDHELPKWSPRDGMVRASYSTLRIARERKWFVTLFVIFTKTLCTFMLQPILYHIGCCIIIQTNLCLLVCRAGGADGIFSPLKKIKQELNILW